MPWDDVPSYGAADIETTPSSQSSFPVTDLVEKPARDAAPSNLAITGRYVLTSEIFDALESTTKGAGGEVQLTDSIRKLDSVRGIEFEGDRYDIGNIPSWLQANIEMAHHHDDGEMNAAVQNLIEEQFA